MLGESIADGEFGEIGVRYDSRAVRCIFRIKDGRLQATLPPGVSRKELLSVIEAKRTALRRLFQHRQESRLTVGSIIETRCFTINVNSYGGEKLLYRLKAASLDVFVPADADMADPQLSERIKKGIMRFVGRSAPAYLKSRLDTAACRLGAEYRSFSVSSGRRILGKCDSRRNIKLSSYLLFYPEELIDYVICHELAHLAVMNHGAAFHELCNRYCGGREAELRRRLRAFPLPL